MKITSRHPIITGTLILTITGFISRIIGFFYRIYLSRLFGEEGMGIYQLLSPVLAISFSLTAAGFQTAISKFVAEQTGKQNIASISPNYAPKTSDKYKYTTMYPMIKGLSISIPLSIACLFFVFTYAEYIAHHILLEPRLAPMLRVLSFSIPLSAVHSCINGYFYGIKKASIPAFTQLIEQCCRVGCVYFISYYAIAHNQNISLNVAVLGLVFGEFISMILSILFIYYHYAKNYLDTINTTYQLKLNQKHKLSSALRTSSFTYRKLLSMVGPLTANRIVLNILASIEAISIPANLKLYGYDNATALSVYGVLTGMAFPFIFFPNAITGSVSVLLLPLISEAYAKGDKATVKSASIKTIKYCLTLGIICMLVFLLIGNTVGQLVFNSKLAGHFITTLSFICPFLYLDHTLSSILHGLGMSIRLFFMNALALLIRLSFIFFTIPMVGISGYLWGLLLSQIVLCALYLICLHSGINGKKN